MLANKAIPLYYQIETILRRKILEGEFESGMLLANEETLAEQYKVSRITLRQALSSLEQDGLIIRKRGKGTFVSETLPGLQAANLTGSMEDLISMGIKTSTKIINFSLTPVARKITDCLALPEGIEVVRIERLRLAKGSPFSYILNHLSPTIGQKIQPADLLVKPLLKILEDDLHIDLAGAIQKIGADIADSYIAPLLKIRVGDPLLKIERTVFDEDQKPVEYVSALYRADRYSYTVRLERKEAERTSQWNL